MSDAFSFTDDDLASLLGSGAVELDTDAPDELVRLSRRISGQYVDVLATFAGQAFAGAPSAAVRSQVDAALDALLRLARASSDARLVEALERLEQLVDEGQSTGRRGRQRFLRELRDWVLGFAQLLPEEDAERMRDLVHFDRKSLPLLDELAEIPGIGRRRLERLYCAGLFTVEVVSAAAPEEIAAVTGLPLALAAAVVAASCRFADVERRRAIDDLSRRAEELERALRLLQREHGDDADLLHLAKSAMTRLQRALVRFDEPKEEP